MRDIYRRHIRQPEYEEIELEISFFFYFFIFRLSNELSVNIKSLYKLSTGLSNVFIIATAVDNYIYEVWSFTLRLIYNESWEFWRCLSVKQILLRGLKFNSIQLSWDLKTFARKLRLTEYFSDHKITSIDQNNESLGKCKWNFHPPRNRNRELETDMFDK